MVLHLDAESNVATKTDHIGDLGCMRCRRRICGEVVHVDSEDRKELGIDAVVSLVVFHDGDEELEEQRCGVI
jgi:hypothetical protein